MMNLFALAFGAATLVQAVPWTEPAKPTPADQVPPAYLAWSSRPTNAPQPYGAMARRDLDGMSPADIFKRQGVDENTVCGYVSGNTSDPVTCPTNTLTCMFNTQVSAVGCCTATDAKPEDCYQQSSCVSYGDTCDDECQTNQLILKCSSTEFPACVTYLFESGYSNLGCDSTAFTKPVSFVSVLETSVRIFTRTATVTKDDDVSATETGTPSGTAELANTSSISTPTDGDKKKKKKKKAPIGAIVGGVVGGLAVILLAALGIFFILRKKKKQNKTNVAPMQAQYAAPGQMGQQPPVAPVGAAAAMQQVPQQQKPYYDPPISPGPVLAYPNGHQSMYEPDKTGYPQQGYQQPLPGVTEAPVNPVQQQYSGQSAGTPVQPQLSGQSAGVPVQPQHHYPQQPVHEVP